MGAVSVGKVGRRERPLDSDRRVKGVDRALGGEREGREEEGDDRGEMHGEMHGESGKWVLSCKDCFATLCDWRKGLRSM